jgi:hypothetical protein
MTTGQLKTRLRLVVLSQQEALATALAAGPRAISALLFQHESAVALGCVGQLEQWIQRLETADDEGGVLSDVVMEAWQLLRSEATSQSLRGASLRYAAKVLLGCAGGELQWQRNTN